MGSKLSAPLPPSLHESDILIDSVGGISISGTIVKPKDAKTKIPVVILLPGSGKIDRNGNQPLMLSLVLYDRLAYEIASQCNVAVFRYNKRGVKPSSGIFEETSFYDFVDDAEKIFQYFNNGQCSSVDNQSIIIAGHSEGCFTATALAARLHAKGSQRCLKGMIMLSGFGVTFKETIEFQRETLVEAIQQAQGCLGCCARCISLDKKVVAQNKETIEIVERSTTKSIKIKGITFPAMWYKELMHFDSKKDAAVIECPVLVLSGTRDVQVDPRGVENAPSWLLNCKDKRCILLKDVNHILRKQEFDATILDIKTVYQNQSRLPLSPELVKECILLIQKVQ